MSGSGFTTNLVTVTGVQYTAEYFRQGRVGALNTLLLHPRALGALRRAQAFLAEQSTGRNMLDIAVYDGYRPPAVQRSIFDEYVGQLMIEPPGLSRVDAQAYACNFVRHPDTDYPHGTGGTVDLTLTINGQPAEMGTLFDDFTERAARCWYQEHLPANAEDQEVAANRELLDAAMFSAGFVGIPSEWWHFEWGTAHWAAERGQAIALQTCPEAEAFDAAS